MAKSSVIDIKILVDDKTGKGFKSATAQVEGFSGKISAAGTALGTFAGNLAANAIPAALNFGKELFNLGSEVEIMGKKAQTVFGKEADLITDWADANNEAMGLSDEALVGLAASMGDLLVPMGFNRREASRLTQDTLNAAGALSAWSGGTKSAAEVSDILTKAMLGEREQLKSLGISINQAEVDQRAMTIAMAEGRDEITAMDKALATQQLILEKSKDAQDAWANGTMDAVKAQNEMRAQLEDLKVAMAEKLVPVMQNVVGFIVDELIPAAQKIAAFIKDNWIPIVAGLTAGFVLLIPALWGAATAGWAAIAPMIAAAAPFLAVVAAVAALTAGVMWLYENWEPFRIAVDATARFMRDTLWPILQKIGGFFADVFVAALGKASDTWDLLVAGVKIGVGLIKTYIETLTTVFKTVFNGIARIWNNSIGKLSFSVPNWVPGIGGKGFSVPKIPMLAEGGIVTGPTLAMIGEAGPEAVVPLSKAGGLGNTINITVNAGVGADGATIGREIVEKIRAYERVNGPGWRAA